MKVQQIERVTLELTGTEASLIKLYLKQSLDFTEEHDITGPNEEAAAKDLLETLSNTGI